MLLQRSYGKVIPKTYRFWGLFTDDEVACREDDKHKKSCSQGEGCVDQHVADAGVMPIEACHMMDHWNCRQHLQSVRCCCS